MYLKPLYMFRMDISSKPINVCHSHLYRRNHYPISINVEADPLR